MMVVGVMVMMIIIIVVVMMVVVNINGDITGRNPPLHNTVSQQLIAVQPQFRQFRFKGIEIRTGVNKRSKCHVAADAGEAVKICCFHWLIMCAKQPAPKPLSIFTTLTPTAQEFNIDNNAANPPKLAP